jgi:hypothetical protein
MTTQNISLRERVYTAITRQSLLVANGVYSLCDMSVEDLRWLYEQIGEHYIAEIEADKVETATIGDTLDKIRAIVADIESKTGPIDFRIGGPEIMDSQSSSDLELCGRIRIVQADAFKIANTEE